MLIPVQISKALHEWFHNVDLILELQLTNTDLDILIQPAIVLEVSIVFDMMLRDAIVLCLKDIEGTRVRVRKRG